MKRGLEIDPNGNYNLKMQDGKLVFEFTEEPELIFHTEKEGYGKRFDRVYEAAHPTRGYEPGDT